MKKIISLLLALLLLPAMVMNALGEEAASGNSRLVFLYFQTQDAGEFRTAQYVVNARTARGSRESISFANINLQRLYDPDRMAEAIKTGKSWDGELSSKVKSNVLDAISGGNTETDLWLLIPGDTVSTVFQQQELFSWIMDTLGGGKCYMHFMLIGDRAEMPEGAAKGLQPYADRFEVTALVSDFLQSTVQPNAGERHTGDYFIASLYGKPVDLPLTKNKAGENTFTLPEDGQVFLLARNGSVQAVKNGQGYDVGFENPQALEIRGPEKKDPGFSGRMTEKIPAGKYTIGTAEKSADSSAEFKAYWYPDMTGLTVSAVLPDPFLHGENTVRFTLPKDYGRLSDIAVDYRCSFNGEETGPATYAEYSKEDGWTAALQADATKNRIRIIPSARLNMKDGNLIFRITGEAAEREIQNQAPVLSAEIPEKLTLYLDPIQNKQGTLRFRWDEIFTYNPADAPHQFAAAAEPEETVQIRQEGDGFTLAATAETGDAPAVLTVSCDETLQARIEIDCRDLEKLAAELVQVKSEQQGTTLKPGQEAVLSVEADPALAEALKGAAAQGLSVPGLESMKAAASLNGQEKQIGLAEPGEKKLIFPAENEAAGERTISYQVISETGGETGADGNRRVWKEGTVTFTLQNNPPVLTGTVEKEVSVPLQGMFGKTEPADLLESVLGTANPGTLFTDDETKGPLTVTLVIKGLAGLETEGEIPKTGEDQATFIFGEEKPGRILLTAPGTHTLTLTASDGVNESESAEVTVKAYSLFIHYLAAGGLILGALLAVLILILAIRQARKPSFSNIRIRCLVTSDEDQERCRELLGKGTLVSLTNFGKKPVPLPAALILTGQPPLSDHGQEIAQDIVLMPARYDEAVLAFGKEAVKLLGRREKKERIAQGNIFRIRLDGTWLYIENNR